MILTTSLTGLLVLTANLIGLIVLAAAAIVLLGAGAGHRSGHRSHLAPAAHVCAETCPIYPPSS